MSNAHTVTAIVFYDKLDNNREVGRIENPPEYEFNVELNIDPDKEVELFTMAFFNDGFYNKSSSPVKLNVNRAGVPVTFNPDTAERITAENIAVHIVYSINATFPVTNDFIFQLEYKSTNSDTWTSVDLTPTKTENVFTADFEIPSAESGLYDFRCKRIDKHQQPSVYTPVKQINKNTFLGYTEGADNFYFGWTDTDNFKVQY